MSGRGGLPATTEAEATDLATLLARIAEEIDDLGVRSRALDRALGALIARFEGRDMPLGLHDLQFQDYLVQCLSSVAAVLKSAARGIPEGQRVDVADVLRDLPLQGVAARLGSVQTGDDETGRTSDVHLF